MTVCDKAKSDLFLAHTDATKQYQPCHSSCKTCDGSETLCTSCPAGQCGGGGNGIRTRTPSSRLHAGGGLCWGAQYWSNLIISSHRGCSGGHTQQTSNKNGPLGTKKHFFLQKHGEALGWLGHRIFWNLGVFYSFLFFCLTRISMRMNTLWLPSHWVYTWCWEGKGRVATE